MNLLGYFTHRFLRMLLGVSALVLLAPPAVTQEDRTDKAAHEPVESSPVEERNGGGGPDLGEAEEILDLDFEDLLAVDVVVTSVSKTPQKVSSTASAVYVITREEIRRSGATSIADVLRWAPGVQVGRIDSNKWAISVRGFNGFFANKLLVLIDGRTVYTPTFSGVYWDVQDVMLQDVDRIEIIRGPGATLWGTNAVNGVINIITRNAADTQGGLLYAGYGTEEQGFLGFRYGGKIGKNAHFRMYGKYFNRDTGDTTGRAHDDWRQNRIGFRTDWNPCEVNSITFQGDWYDGVSGHQVTIPIYTPPYALNAVEDMDVSGANLLARWTHRFSESSEMILQMYYDRTERNSPILIRERRDTFDLDVQFRRPLPLRQEIICGFGYRVSRDIMSNTQTISFVDRSETLNLVSLFLQDEIAIIPESLRFTLGSKFEYNEFTGLEVQPNGRLHWTPVEGHAAWAAVSRAVRTPSRAEDDVSLNLPRVPGPIPGSGLFPRLLRNRDFDSEDLLALEVGYRARPTPNLSIEVAGFLNDYDDLSTLEQGTPFPAPSLPPLHAVLPIYQANKMDGRTYGVEVSAEWQPFNFWKLRGSYSFLRMSLTPDSDSVHSSAETNEEENPRNQASVQSRMNLPARTQLDFGLRYVDRLPALDIPAYVQLDARLAWKPTEDLELSLVGRNLLDPRQPEFASSFLSFQQTEVERSVYAMLTLKF